MKRLAGVLFIALSTFAASWDGTHGSFQLVTFTSPASVPDTPSTGQTVTVLFITCTDSTVSAARAQVSYHDSSGDHTTQLLSNITNGYGGFVTAIPQSQITGVTLSELRDGATY